MLFSTKLKNEIYTPWEEHYIAYDQLKRLLQDSGVIDGEWSEEDESRFVQLLDKELDKVYGFETAKFDDLNTRLIVIEEQFQDPAKLVSQSTEGDLESILQDTTHLDRFRRINYTGFAKIVRKHDRLHPMFHLWPLLQARFRSSPFHADSYRPLLRRLGKLYTQIDNPPVGSVARSHAFNSMEKDYHSNGYVTLQFWVHPDNLMEVKTRVLRKLPVLVYNREDDEEESDRDPVVTSLYLDSKQFKLYQSLLDSGAMEIEGEDLKNAGLDTSTDCSLRFRWYGKLNERPDIVFERHNEQTGQITRITIKEKIINKFLSGDGEVIEKQARKMRERRVHSSAINEYVQAAKDLQRFVTSNKLEPMLRTVYKRTAFEIPGDDKVRVILDQDILFLREDSLDANRPVRDSADWHRSDVDLYGIDSKSVLRKGEFARFPYSVLEVRLRSDLSSQTGAEKLPWITELQDSGLIKEIPHFTKFLHGVSVLYGDDDRLGTLPFWLSELDPSTGASAGASEADPSGTNSAPVAGPSTGQYKFDDDEYAELDSDDSGVLGEFGPSDSDSEGDVIGLPTRIRGKLGDEESEDDEVNLPAGVERPSQWIKNQSSPKIEAKVWLANERTFNKWLHITCLMSALTFTLYSSVGRASSQRVANYVAFTLFCLTLFCGVWGYVQYLNRRKYILAREDKAMDAMFGPIVVSFVLLGSLVVNFWAVYKSKGL